MTSKKNQRPRCQAVADPWIFRVAATHLFKPPRPAIRCRWFIVQRALAPLGLSKFGCFTAFESGATNAGLQCLSEGFAASQEVRTSKSSFLYFRNSGARRTFSS